MSDLITDLQTLMDANILSGPEMATVEDFIERVDEPDPPVAEWDEPFSPSEERRQFAEEVLQRNYTHLINIQQNQK